MRFKSLFLVLMLAAAFPACGGDDDDDNGSGGATGGTTGKGGSGGKGATGGSSNAGADSGGAPGAGEGGTSATAMNSISKDINAEDGGEVVLGDASLSIPGGSLAGDTTVTLETSSPSSDLPDAGTLKGLLYDFGPDGTEFTKPAALTLPSAGTPGADEEAVIAWLDEDKGAWQDLATTVNDDGSLTAEITHFTKFVVRFNGVVQSDCGFSACGGDVVGTWTVTGVCAVADALVEQVCPSGTAELDLALTGTATFADDGTSTTDFTSKATITYTLTAECLMNIAGGMLPADCESLSKEADPANDEGPTTCTGDPSVSCTCVEEQPEKTETKTGTYTVDGSTMTTTDDGDSEAKTLEFCVNGKEARFQQTDGLAVLTWIATKK